jgi:hypothetical protein
MKSGFTRRTLISRAATVAAGLGLGLSPAARLAAQVQPDLPFSVIGYSQLGEPLVIHHLGDAPQRILLMGGQHGGPEHNTTWLAQFLMQHFAEHPEEIPHGHALDFLPLTNPDGTRTGSRQFISGVDPNRNWGTSNWSPDAWDSNARFREGLGGPEPFSEQETRALADWLLQTRPALVVNYHSVGGFMFGNNAVGRAYSVASGYYIPGGGGGGTPGGGGGGGGGSPLTYRATGSMNPWVSQQGIDSIFIELGSATSAEFTRNLAGLHAAFAVLADAGTA